MIIYEKSNPGRKGFSLPSLSCDEAVVDRLLDKKFLRATEAELPELSKPTLVRHYIELSTKNHHIDKNFYPLGSCTMKYNPRVNDLAAGLPGFAGLHPLLDDDHCQGALQIMYELAQLLSDTTGFHSATLQPVAGAHCELIGLLIIRAALTRRGNARKKVIIPDSAHGTNPASVVLAGYECRQIKSTEDGILSAADVAKVVDSDTAAMMITNPNTLGLFESEIEKITRIVHEAGGLVYMDGANLNALLGQAKPAEMGYDVLHFNLHKTFSTPHGGGGPGAGALAVTEELEPFIPKPKISKKGDRYFRDFDRPYSVGQIHSHYGNFANMVRAYTYIRHLGPEGLRRVSENAVLNANYLMHLLKDIYELPHERTCMHEFVLSAVRQKKRGIRAIDIAKRLLDFGMHAPTIYFPLIVSEAIMIEPTETESVDTLDRFAEIMCQIDGEIEKQRDMLLSAPHTTPVRRLDEVRATRELDINYQG